MQRILFTVFIALTLLFSITPAATAALPAPAGYIVVLHDSVDSPAAAARGIARQVGGQVGFIYEHALKGFSIMVPPQAVAAMEKNPKVKYVATDDIRYAFTQDMPTGIKRIFADTNTNIDIDATDDYRVDVDVAVIDTGVDFEHPDLNVMGGVICTGNPFRVRCKSGGDDDHYHGTHVAGTIGAIDNGIGVVGVAPGARIWAVKVLDSRGSGYTSWIIAGIDWVAANADTIEVANMSLGGYGYSQAEYDAIQGAVNNGVAFAVAAGNEDDDAIFYSPAAFDNVLTVSALADFDGKPEGLGSPTCRTDQDDTLADFSNWGSAVQIAAPGVCILSTFPLEQGEYGTISGTSMASPHVAGALALLASAYNPDNAADVNTLYNQVINAGNFNWTDDSGDSIKEPLLDVSTFEPVLIPGDGGGDGDTNNPPTASFLYSNSGLTVDFTDTSTDSDGTCMEWSWDFGDGNTSATQSPEHTYAASGTYTVELTVTDNEGATDSTTQAVSVSDGSGTTITLSATGKQNRNWLITNLDWSGATSTDVDIYRRDGVDDVYGVIIVTTSNDGAYTDKISNNGGESYFYKVCEAGTSNCSNEATVTFN
jgi:subtilisin family serine protease